MPEVEGERSSGPPARRGLAAINGALAVLGVVLVVQMWLLTATLETYLAGAHHSALPGAVGSAVLFAASVGLYRFVARVDRESRRGTE